MRRITVILMSIAALALASSCNKKLNPETSSNGLVYKTIHLSASEILTNKAAFGEKEDGAYPMLWSSDDKVIICVNNDPELTQELSVTPVDGGKAADFEACTLALPAEGEITIRVTTNTTTASGGTEATVKYSPDSDKSQAPQAASCDPESLILFAKETYARAADVPADISLNFAHATAYGLMSISGISLNGGETIKFVEIQAMSTDVKIAGNVTLDGDGVLSAGSHTSLTMRGMSDLSNPIWFAIAPSELNSASALAIHVVTSEDRHFEKILDCSSTPLKFQAGRISKFGVNFSGIVSAPRQVETIRDLVILKNAFNQSDYGYWLDSNSEIFLANDLNYSEAAISGTADLPEGITFNGQNHTLRNAKYSAVIFRHVYGTVKNLGVDGGTNSTTLFRTVPGTLKDITITGLSSQSPLISSVSGTVDGFTVDKTSSYTCSWSAADMGLVTLENTGLIENSEVAATVAVDNPELASFNFGVFCPKCTSGRFVKCVNKSNVTIATSTSVNGCSLGGIVGVIESTQENSVNILDECENEGEITLTLSLPAGESDYHRVCCVGGIAGGNYKGGVGSGVWKATEHPSTGTINKCLNSGIVTLNYNSLWVNASSNNKGAVGMTVGGVIGATTNDMSYCINSGSVIGNFNIGTTNKAGAPKVGGVVGAAHGKVLHCDNESTAKVEINGQVRNTSSNLYSGTGPVCYPAFGGVAGCVGCNTAENSVAEGSEISDCTNKSANVINNTTYSSSFVGSVCGWTVATNSGNTDLGGTGLPVLNPE